MSTEMQRNTSTEKGPGEWFDGDVYLGYAQSRGEELIELHPGDTVYTLDEYLTTDASVRP